MMAETATTDTTFRSRSDMSLMEHLQELRSRLVVCLIAVFFASCASFFFSREIFDLLSRPYFEAFTDRILIGTGPSEAFVLRIQVSIFAGMILVSPILFFQIWKFIAPGLHDTEKRLFIPFIFISTMLFLLGVWFCYVVALPFSFRFFYSQYLSIGVTPEIRITEHLPFVVKLLLAFGFLFEMPVLSYFLGRLGVIDHKTLIHYARHATVVMFVIAAFIAPDVLTQILLAAPLMALYGISILVVKLTAPTKQQ